MIDLLQIAISGSAMAYSIFGILIAIIGFFLKVLHGDVKDSMNARVVDREEMGKLKGKIELVEQGSKLEIKAITKSMDDLTSEVRRMNDEMKSKHDDMVKIFNKLTEEK